MERRGLETMAANYPYLQGLWGLPFGFMIMLAGVSNLEQGPPADVTLGILGSGLLLALGVSWLIAGYYRDNYGAVTQTRGRLVRQAVAVVTWVLVLFVLSSRFTFWTPDSARCVYAAAFAVATMAYYSILVGLRLHHVVIWGIVLVAGLLPIWGGFGADRDAVAMFPLGVALIASGLLDQRLLSRSFDAATRLKLEDSNVAE